MPNRLAQESSPYLLQHKDNPVEWMPWGKEAFELAKQRDRPVLLSIGYSACHWCHVMAHESFEDVEVADMMNRLFVNIKVDREELPNVDSVYMSAVTTLTGRGGWPLTAFLTPEGKPFFGGTYFPNREMRGMPSFRTVLGAIADAWDNRRDTVLQDSEFLTAAIRKQTDAGLPSGATSYADIPTILTSGDAAFAEEFDPINGGFGHAPKFPQPASLGYLLRRWERTKDQSLLGMVTLTLEKMAQGGIRDHLAGGFARYSTDGFWLVPHFEKMLYDNALLASAYLQGWQASGLQVFADTTADILSWIERDMSHSEGAFFSALDADSEGREGVFYVWTPEQIESAIGAELARVAFACWNVTDSGNFEGANILHQSRSEEETAALLKMSVSALKKAKEEAREGMLKARGERIAPGLDFKAVAAWNGMTISAFARCGASMGRPEWVERARRCGEFILREMFQDDRLLRTWTETHGGRHDGTMEDYAFLAEGFIALWEADFDRRWLDTAELLCDCILRLFRSKDKSDNGYLYDAAEGSDSLIVRPRSFQDGATPSGGSAAVLALMRTASLTGRREFADAATTAILGATLYMEKIPTAVAHWLSAADFMHNPVNQVVVVGDMQDDRTQEFLKVARREMGLRSVLAWTDGTEGVDSEEMPLLHGKGLVNGAPAAYVCRDYVCDLPSKTPAELQARLAE